MSDEGYIPPDADGVAKTIIRAGNPAVKGLNLKMIIGIGSILAAVTFIAFSQLSQDRNKPKEAVKAHESTPVVSDQVSNLPNSYAEVQQHNVPKLGPPRPGEFATTVQQQHQPNEAEKAMDAARAERIKEESEASKSKIQFNVANNSNGYTVPPANGITNADINTLQGIMSPHNDGSGHIRPSADLARDADNRQDDKSEFANKKRSTDPYLKQGLIKPTDPYFISAGTIIPGVLLTGINSDLPGQITGQVSQDVFDTVTGKYLLIPQGTKLVGEYNSTITYGQERVQIIWTRVIRPDGSSISLEGMPGADLSGNAGLSEKVNNHWMKLLGGVVISSVLGAGGQIAQGGTSQLNPSFGQLAAQGTGANLNDVGQQLTRKNLNIQPTLEISPGGRFNVFVNHDIELAPYAVN